MIILAADITQLNDEMLFDCAYNKLTTYRKEKTDRMKNIDDKKRSIASGILLNCAVKMYVENDKVNNKQTDNEKTDTQENTGAICIKDLYKMTDSYSAKYDYDIAEYENGKPYFSGHSEVCFNLSHSGRWAVCVVCDKPSGIDIECSKPFKNQEKVAKRFFSLSEYNWLTQEDNLHFSIRFLRLWTLKEAYAKVTGAGIGKTITQMEFEFKNNIPEFKNKSLKEKYQIYEYVLNDSAVSIIKEK